MMKRSLNDAEATERETKRLRFDMGPVVSMIKNLMSSANAVPFLRKGRFEECDDKMYLEDVLTRVEDGSHQDIEEVFDDIYKVLRTEREGNEIQLEDQEKQVYDEADALIMAGMMMKTAKSLQKEIEDVLKVDEEDRDGTLILDSSPNVLQQLKKKFGSLSDNYESCCPPVFDPYTLVALLGGIALATYFLRIVIITTFIMMRRSLGYFGKHSY